MKNLIAVCCLVYSVTVHAQTTSVSTPAPIYPGKKAEVVEFPPVLPISSPAVMVANAKKLITSVSVNVGSRGFVWGSPDVVTGFNRQYTPAIQGQVDFNELLKIANEAQFTFDMKNPNEWISLSVSFRAVVGTGRERRDIELFSGGTGFNLVKNADETYSLPAPPYEVHINPSGTLPVSMPGADYVEVAFLDERGQTSGTQSLEAIGSGVFLFPTHLAGQENVQITVSKYADNSLAVYSGSGKQEQIRRAHLAPTSVLDNVVIIPKDVNVVHITTNDPLSSRVLRNGVVPLVQIHFTSPKMLHFYAEVPGEVAAGLWIRKTDNNTWSYFALLNGREIELQVPDAGIYDIVPHWKNFGNYQQTFGDYCCEGKG